MHNLNIQSYLIYLSISGIITIYVGKDLHKNGYHLILNLFKEIHLSKTINNILLMGYYLVNIGYIAITIQQFEAIPNTLEMMQALSQKIGIILLILGSLHINNIIVLNLLSKNRTHLTNL